MCLFCDYVSISDYFFSVALPAHSGPRPLLQFRNHFSQSVGLLGRVISPSQGRYLYTGQHKHRINAYIHTPNIHALSGIRTHDPSVRASENSSCLRPRCYCDQRISEWAATEWSIVSRPKSRERAECNTPYLGPLRIGFDLQLTQDL
jgi:hypothetical protein